MTLVTSAQAVLVTANAGLLFRQLTSRLQSDSGSPVRPMGLPCQRSGCRYTFLIAIGTSLSIASTAASLPGTGDNTLAGRVGHPGTLPIIVWDRVVGRYFPELRPVLRHQSSLCLVAAEAPFWRGVTVIRSRLRSTRLIKFSR
jgi:hypothetical protein